jgi:hypothetical protein
MRKATLVLIAASAALFSAGACAPSSTSSIAPTVQELPRLEQRSDVLPVSVGVEGQAEQQGVVLVAPMKEPELTPEERKVLGEQEPTFNWLEFYQPVGAVQRISPDYGGASASIHGMGGAAVWLTGFRPGAGAGPDWGGVVPGVTGGTVQRYSRGGAVRQASSAGPASQVNVGETPARRAAAHQTHSER